MIAHALLAYGGNPVPDLDFLRIGGGAEVTRNLHRGATWLHLRQTSKCPQQTKQKAASSHLNPQNKDLFLAMPHASLNSNPGMIVFFSLTLALFA